MMYQSDDLLLHQNPHRNTLPAWFQSKWTRYIAALKPFIHERLIMSPDARLQPEVCWGQTEHLVPTRTHSRAPSIKEPIEELNHPWSPKHLRCERSDTWSLQRLKSSESHEEDYDLSEQCREKTQKIITSSCLNLNISKTKKTIIWFHSNQCTFLNTDFQQKRPTFYDEDISS